MQDIQLQALHRVDELVNNESHEVMAARLWALFWATTARLRYRGVPRAAFAQTFEEACCLAENTMREDLERASDGHLSRAEDRPRGVVEYDAPSRLM